MPSLYIESTTNEVLSGDINYRARQVHTTYVRAFRSRDYIGRSYEECEVSEVVFYSKTVCLIYVKTEDSDTFGSYQSQEIVGVYKTPDEAFEELDRLEAEK